MKYLGSKRRIVKEILPLILKDRAPGQWFVEPFCGGCNLTEHVDGNVLAADAHPELISLFTALQNGWEPPTYVSETEYEAAKQGAFDTVPWAKAFILFCCSFGGGYSRGYARYVRKNGKADNFADIGSRHLLKQIQKLKHVNFRHSDFSRLEVPAASIIYCDPPYKGTTGYSTAAFDHDEFWRWCLVKASEGHTVYVSEATAPENPKIVKVWEKGIKVTIDRKNNKEKVRWERLYEVLAQ